MRLIALAGTLAALLMPAAVSATPLVDADWLQARLDGTDLVVLDIRNGLDGGSLETFAAGHVPGAVYSNYLEAGWRTEVGGVIGMTPSLPSLEALIGNLGIGNDDEVVIVYAGKDATDLGSAARVYWTFKYLGHDAVSILDGGYRAWVAGGERPVETGIAATPVMPDLFVAEPRPEMIIGTDEVLASLADPQVVRVDGRPLAQFVGAAKHPKANSPGRIPASIGLEQALFVDADAKLRSTDELQALVPAAVANGSADLVVSYCNTGHWAATNWFVLSELLGYRNVKLYDASMVGWTANPALPIETGNSPLDSVSRWLAAVVPG